MFQCLRVKPERLAGSSLYAYVGVELREELFDHTSESVHHAHDTHHSGSYHSDSRSAHTGDDIDGIVPLLGEEVAPRYDMLYSGQ